MLRSAQTSAIVVSNRYNLEQRMKIHLTNVFVDDQDKAEKFYSNILGFKVKNDIASRRASLADGRIK